MSGGRGDIRAAMLVHYRHRRTLVNRKAAWCIVVPPLGWFGRAARLEAEHARLNRLVHGLLLALSGVGSDTTGDSGKTPKSAGPQAPSFPMNKADHAGGLAIKERA